ncbi:MAG: isochorismatase family protein [Candidimonas sp.]|jgi:nicotinamidase-related amidase
MSLLHAHESLLLIVDVQRALTPSIHDGGALVDRIERLARAAHLLDVPVVATEHCADKIGPTVDSLTPWIGRTFHKTYFDATREPDFLPGLPRHRPRVLLAGMEAHVCVLQTALGLAAAGLSPMLVQDGIGSRREADMLAAQARWAGCRGLGLTSEMAMFEWLESARHPRFREVLSLIKQS